MNIITFENTEDVIGEVEKAFFDIPFENSQFQTECFVLASQITPERAYRALGLRMHSKLSALNEVKFAILRDQIDIDEIDHKLATEDLSVFERRRQELKKQEILSKTSWTNKLINDAITELNILYKHFKALPRYTRQDFESGEKRHFEQKLGRQLAGLEGTKESLINMNEDIKALEYFEEVSGLLENSSDMENLLKSLPNLLKEEQK